VLLVFLIGFGLGGSSWRRAIDSVNGSVDICVLFSIQFGEIRLLFFAFTECFFKFHRYCIFPNQHCGDLFCLRLRRLFDVVVRNDYFSIKISFPFTMVSRSQEPKLHADYLVGFSRLQ